MELMTKKDAAAVLTVSVRSLERMIAAGDLPVYRIGSAVRLSRSDLDAYIMSRRTQVINVSIARGKERRCAYVPGMKVV